MWSVSWASISFAQSRLVLQVFWKKWIFLNFLSLYDVCTWINSAIHFFKGLVGLHTVWDYDEYGSCQDLRKYKFTKKCCATISQSLTVCEVSTDDLMRYFYEMGRGISSSYAVLFVANKTSCFWLALLHGARSCCYWPRLKVTLPTNQYML